MLGVSYEWLFVVTDTGSQDADMSSFISMGQDGANLAFVFDTSQEQSGASCPSGLLCSARELVKTMANSFENTLQREMVLFSQVNYELWK